MAITYSSNFVAGRYTATWGESGHSNNFLGVTEDGFEIEKHTFGEELVGDNLGDTVQDIIYRGGNVYINVTFVEWDTHVLNALKMFSTPLGDVGDHVGGHVGAIGRQHVNMGGSSANKLILVVESGTTAAGTGGLNTFFAEHATIAPGFVQRINLNNRHRKIPLRFQLLPYIPDGQIQPVWYQTTAVS